MAASTVMTQDAWEAALSSGKYSKTWLTNTMVRMQKHEKEMAFMAWMSRDEEAKYFAGVALGAASGAFGAMLSTFLGGGEPPQALPDQVFVPEANSMRFREYQIWIREKQQEDPNFKKVTFLEWLEYMGYGYYVSVNEEEQKNGWKWLTLPALLGGGGIVGAAILSLGNTTPSLDPTLGMAGNIAEIMKLGGAGFAGFCAMVLILKAIFSGTDLGELMSGAGEIIPL